MFSKSGPQETPLSLAHQPNRGWYVRATTLTASISPVPLVLTLALLMACESSDAGDAGDAGDAAVQTPECEVYIACLGALMSPDAIGLLATYGSQGSCWQGTAAEADLCTQECTARVDELSRENLDEPACQPAPTDPTEGPVPFGPYIDCAELPPAGPTVAPEPVGVLEFPTYACDPRQSGSANGYHCCSTDPATADGDLPAYEGKDIDGSTPLYADAANDEGTWGMCVHVADIPIGAGLLSDAAMNCPIPCDPQWSDDDVSTVCGQGRVCCQVLELKAADCVQDNGVWRAVTGEDIGSLDISPATNWSNDAHETHQDPNGTVCSHEFPDSQEDFIQCVRQLGVADRRGYCMNLGDGQCPGRAADYVDVCEAMN